MDKCFVFLRSPDLDLSIYRILNFLTVSFLYQFNRPRYNQDFIVVLGAGLINGETVSPLLAKRINKAIAFYRAQSRATLNPPILLMSGGQGADEKYQRPLR